MAIFPTDAIDRLKQYNSDTYDPVANPYGMADGGHRNNFPRATSDTASVGDYIQETASEVQTNALAAAASAGNADAARQLAERWASNPENVVVSGGLYSARHYSLKAAASAAAAATFDPANFYTRTASDNRYFTKDEINNARWPVAKLEDINGPAFIGRQTGLGTPAVLNRSESRLTLGVGTVGGQLMDAETASAGRAAIEAGRPARITTGGQASTSVGAAWTALAFFDFVATSPQFFANGAVITVGQLVTINTEIRLFAIGQTEPFSVGPRLASTNPSNGHASLNFIAYEGLNPGTSYRARLYAFVAVGSAVNASSNIMGGCI